MLQIVISSAHQTRDNDPMLGSCWVSVADDGPTLNHHLMPDQRRRRSASIIAASGQRIEFGKDTV